MNATMIKETTHSIEELSQILEVSNGTICRWIKEGKVKASKEGGKYTIPVKGNNEFIIAHIQAKYNKPPAVKQAPGVLNSFM